MNALRSTPQRPGIAGPLEGRIVYFICIVLLVCFSTTFLVYESQRVGTATLESKVLKADSNDYYDIGRAFAQGDFSMSYIEGNAHRMPLYPMTLIPAFRFWNGEAFPLLMTNVVMIIFGAWIVFWLLIKLTNSALGALISASWLFGDWTLRYLWTFRLYTEPLYIILVLCAFIIFLLYLRNERPTLLFTAAVLGGLALSTRLTGLFFVCAMLGVGFVRQYIKNRNLKTVSLHFSVAALLVVLVVTPMWLPRLIYKGNPLYVGGQTNFIWVDSKAEYKELKKRLTFKDFLERNSIGDIGKRIIFGHKHVYREVLTENKIFLFFYLGVFFALFSKYPIYRWGVLVFYVNSLPFIWLAQGNPLFRWHYGAMLPYVIFYLGLAFALSITMWRDYMSGKQITTFGAVQ